MFKPGVISALVLLVVLSLVAASGVAIIAQQKKFGRQLTYINARPSLWPSPSILPFSVKGPCYPYGDVNDDKLVDKIDTDVILRYDVGLEKIPPRLAWRADVDMNYKIDVVDGLKILRYVAGFETTFPICPEPPPSSGIFGVAFIGPTCPVEKPGLECTDTPYKGNFEVIDKKGKTIVTTTVDTFGRFKINLQPGEYKLIATNMLSPVEKPVVVKVTNQFSFIELFLDSGIR